MPKICNKCNVSREDNFFGKDARNHGGLTGICNPCKVEANRSVREKRKAENSYRQAVAKACKDCNVVKAPEDFFQDKAAKDGLASLCKECKTKKTMAWRAANKDRYNTAAREYSKARPEIRYGAEIKRKYGCTLERYNEMLAAQQGKCAICAKLHDPANKKGRLFVDHDHATGAIRALLCSACNSGLGYFKDDTDLILKAVTYITRHKK